MNCSLHWKLQNISVPMLRICMQLEGQENYENGLCPTDYTPLLTIKSGQRPFFLGNNYLQYNAFERLQFSGNLSTGELSFTMNVTDDEDSHYTFLPLVKLPGDFIARCHRNLTRYQLVVKGNVFLNKLLDMQLLHYFKLSKINNVAAWPLEFCWPIKL